MQAWQIAVIIAGSLVALYLLLVVIDVIFVVTFKKIFIKHNHSLGICLQSKYDKIRQFIDALTKHGTVINIKTLEKLNTIKPSCFVDQETAECAKARDDLNVIRDDLIFLLHQDEMLRKHEDIKRLISFSKEIDVNYRTLVAMYNADVLGYNYWIAFLPTRFIYKNILKVKEKQIIA